MGSGKMNSVLGLLSDLEIRLLHQEADTGTMALIAGVREAIQVETLKLIIEDDSKKKRVLVAKLVHTAASARALTAVVSSACAAIWELAKFTVATSLEQQRLVSEASKEAHEHGETSPARIKRLLEAIEAHVNEAAVEADAMTQREIATLLQITALTLGSDRHSTSERMDS